MSAIFFITETPYVIEPDDRIIVFPKNKEAERHPVVAAMNMTLPVKMEFPCYGQWIPEDDQVNINFNMDWRLQKVEKPHNLFNIVNPNPDSGLYLYFGFLDSSKFAAATPVGVSLPTTSGSATASLLACILVLISVVALIG